MSNTCKPVIFSYIILCMACLVNMQKQIGNLHCEMTCLKESHNYQKDRAGTRPDRKGTYHLG